MIQRAFGTDVGLTERRNWSVANRCQLGGRHRVRQADKALIPVPS